MPKEHFQHVATFIAEVFGGPADYSANHGGHAAMIRKHLGRGITEPQRRRWVSLLLETADELSLPTDPEFRSALVAYLEWGSRLAVINSTLHADTPIEAARCPHGTGASPEALTNRRLPRLLVGAVKVPALDKTHGQKHHPARHPQLQIIFQV
jgi:hypothetical protein